MDPTNGKHDVERRLSVRRSIRLSVAVDDDDHDIPNHVPSDGLLRPTDLPPSQASDSRLGQPDQLAVPQTTSDTTAPQRPSTAPSRPSSIAKPPRLHDSFALRGENGGAIVPQHTVLSRVSSTSSDNPLAQAEPPQGGASAPSHPYEMYQQRALSITTDSTGPAPEGPFSPVEHQGPTHPYGLYPQSTAPEGIQSGAIPLGFPGVADGYQRRIGPDGEEVAGLIGPLGHTEELPPYSRYPDEAYARKALTTEQSGGGQMSQTSTQLPPGTVNPQAQTSASVQPLAAVAASTSQTITPIPGAGGIGLATRDPEYASTADLDSPRSRLSTRSFTTDSSHEINTAARGVTEKDGDKKWKQKARKKIWGIVPYWAICLLAMALVVMGAVLGAVIGTFIAKHRRGPPRDGSSFQHNPNGFDPPRLLEFPPDLPPLEVGAFRMPLLIASQAPSTCFNITTQAQAWTCNMPLSFYVMEVQKLSDQPRTADYSLKYTTPNNTMMFSKFLWGTRPPVIPDPMQMVLVNDTYEPGYGPAWWLKMPYNKTVIISEDRFPGVTTPVERRGRKRNWPPPPPPPENGTEGSGEPKPEYKGDYKGDYKGKKPPMPLPAAQQGDKAWICTWPGTVLEFFIYPRVNNSYNLHTATATWTGSFEFPTPTRVRSGSGTSSSSTTTTTTATDAAAETGAAAGVPPDNANTATTSTTGAPPAPSGPMGDPWEGMKPPGPPYPKIIKISERRLPTRPDTVASCKKVEIIDEGRDAKPVLDEFGVPIEVDIPEKIRWPPPSPDRRWLDPSEIYGRELPVNELSDCGCIWMFQ